MSERGWTLNPADLAFLWQECARCFYLKVARGFPRPEPAPPALLRRLDAQLKAACDGRRTERVAPDMPAGVFEIGERVVESQPIDVHLPDAVLRCVLRGSLDTLVRLDDGGYALAQVQAGRHVAACTRQLDATAYALEHPAPGGPAVGPITRLGLLVFEPEKFAGDGAGIGALSGGLSWLEIPRDDGRLFGLLAEALSILQAPQPPGGTPLCPWCVYRDASRRTGL